MAQTARSLTHGALVLDTRESGAVVDVLGEIDMSNADGIGSLVRKALMAGAQRVRVDFTNTSFMDSAGVHALLDAQEASDRYGTPFEVLCPPGPALRVIELTGKRDALPGLRVAA